MPLADKEAPTYIATSLGDGLAAGAAGTQVATDQEGKGDLKTPCFPGRFHIVSALQSNRLGNEKGKPVRLSRAVFCGLKASVFISAEWLKGSVDTGYGLL